MVYNCTAVDGLRSVRVLNIVLLDFIMTLLCGYILGKVLYFYAVPDLHRKDKGRRICIFVCIITLYCVGILTHYLASVDTQLNNALGIGCSPIRKFNCKLY
jgi:hypothetical protein